MNNCKKNSWKGKDLNASVHISNQTHCKSLMYNRYPVPFPEVKRGVRGVDHPPPSSAEAKERVELYLYSPTGSS